MTARCIRNTAAVAILAALAGASPAAAQLSLDQGAAPVLNAPTPLWTPRGREPAAVQPEQAPATVQTETAIGGIRIDELAPIALTSDGVGTVDGLGPDMWRGTSRGLIVAYLPRLPFPSASPAERSLARKLLLTGAVPPPAEGSSESLLARRFAALAAMGDADSFIALAHALPNANDPVSARAQVEASFLAGDDATACAGVEGAPKSSTGDFWTQARAVCDIVAGRKEQAQLTLDLLNEQGTESPFVALLRAVLGDRTPIGSLAGAGPVEAALLRLSKAQVSADALADASPLALRAIALDQGDITARLGAAERAEAMGAISTDKLKEIYAVVPFKSDELGNAMSLAANDSSPRGRALFYRAEQQARGVPAAAAEVIAAALSSAREQGRFSQAARIYGADIATIDPGPELQWFAADAARALYSTGAVARAEIWRAQMARTDGAGGAMLWPLATIASTPVPAKVAGPGVAVQAPLRSFDTVGFNRWVATLPESERQSKGAVVLTLLDAMGAGVPPETWAPYLDAANATRVSPLLGPLSRAADGGRSGETVLLALVALGSGDPARWSPDTVGAVGAALNRVNLGGDAAALVLDSAVASGL
ncbi:MAG TPA: hypothetical protein VL966_17940 [Alphaproteobacteria bacterium]|jgi:hypothetical protein|nr:hypothetical protein [Alphaproteobacteria bacterium]